MKAKRQVSYQWRLREVMAAHGMFTMGPLGAMAEPRRLDPADHRQ
jgi:hypothetical protein